LIVTTLRIPCSHGITPPFGRFGDTLHPPAFALGML
jgi:hypothetical protein